MLFVLGANQAESKSAQGKFVMVEAATGDVVVVVTFAGGRQDAVKLRARDQARFEEEFNAIRVMDISGAANTVEIETGFAQLIPRQDGGPVQITGQAVPLDVSAAPVTVEFAAPPAVTINGGVNATINDPVEVFTNALAPLHVNPVQVEPGAAPLLVEQALVVETEENSPGTVVPGAEMTLATQATIVANVDRVALHLKAPAGNVGAVWLGSAVGSGISMEPGEEKVIHTTAAVVCTAATSGDKLQFMETVR